MGFLIHFIFTWWGLLLEALALIHFFRRRPDMWWLFVIIFLGPLGAVIYLFIEAAPDLSFLSRQSARGFSRRKRIRELEALVQVNIAVGNFEELGDLYMDDGRLPQARAAFDRAIKGGSTTLDPFYKRGACAVLMGDGPRRHPRPRACRQQRNRLRLPPRRRTPCPGLRPHRPERQGRSSLSPGHCNFDHE